MNDYPHSPADPPRARERGVGPSASTVTNTLLDRSEVGQLMGVSPATASKIMKESGRSIRIHSRLYIFNDSLFDYLREREEGGHRA